MRRPAGCRTALQLSYDVFLLQGAGVAALAKQHAKDLSLKARAPLKLLRRFRPELIPGHSQAATFSYLLPPRVAHCGVALGECITWSIGLRAPDAQEVVGSFLEYLHDHLSADGVYRDADLLLQRHPL